MSVNRVALIRSAGREPGRYLKQQQSGVARDHAALSF